MALHLTALIGDLEIVERVRLEDEVVSVHTRSAVDDAEFELLLDIQEAGKLRDGLTRALKGDTNGAS